MVDIGSINDPYFVDPSLSESEQWIADTRYVIGIMARRDAYFTDWDVSDIVGAPPEGCTSAVNDLLREAETNEILRYTGKDDILFDGAYRRIWIGVKK